MKKTWIRLSALFLAVLMAVTCLPFTVWAAEGESSEPENLALNQPVYASGIGNNYGPGRAVDGSTSSYWEGNAMKTTNPNALLPDSVAWIVVDLWQNGKVVDEIESITINYSGNKAWPTKYVVHAAADGAVDFDTYSTPSNNNEVTDDSFDEKYREDYSAWQLLATFDRNGSTATNTVDTLTKEDFLQDVPENVRYIRLYFTEMNINAAAATGINVREITVMGTRKAAEPEQPEQPEIPERVTGERQYELVTESELESGYYVLRSWPKGGQNVAVATIRREANASAVSECKDITIGDGTLNLVGGHDDEHVWLVLKTEDGYTIQSMSEGNGYLNHAANTSSSTNIPVSDTPATFQITYGSTDGANGAAVTNAFAVSWDNNGTPRYINHSGSVWHGFDGWGIGIAFYKEVSKPATTEPEQPTPPPVDENAYTPEQAERDGKTVKYLSFTGGTNPSRWWDVADAAGDTAKIHLYNAAGTATSSAITLDTDGVEAGNYVIIFAPNSTKPAVMHRVNSNTDQCDGTTTTVNHELHLFTFATVDGDWNNAFTIRSQNDATKYLSLDQAASSSQRAFKDDATTFYVTPVDTENNDGSYYIWTAEEPAPAVDYSTWDKAQTVFTGTTTGEPFSTEDVGTRMFRIPAIITLDNGWLVAAADVRWAGWNDNPANLDTIVSVSRDNGATWEWEVVNYFGDYANTVQGMPSGSNPGSAAFIDPALVQAADGKVWLAIDVTAANGKATAGSTGFDSQNRLLVAHVPAYVDQKAPGDTSLYTYYVSKVGTSYAVDGENVTLYPIESSNGATDSSGVYVDAFMNLYKVENGVAAKEWCKQDGAEKAVQNNLFYKQSPWKVFPTCFIMLRSATVTESGLVWDDPIFTNVRYVDQTQPFFGVCPGRGTVTESGRIIFPVYDNATGEKSSTIYSDDNGATWQRGSRSVIGHGGKTSESQIIALPDGTLRMYSRNAGGTRNASYADSTDGGVTWSATKADTGLQHGSNCMYSIINVEGVLKGPNGESYEDVVMVSYPEGNGGASEWGNRSNGSLRLGYISGSTSEGWTINWLGEPKLFHGTAGTYFAYSCLTQFGTKDEPVDKFAVLYEPNDNATSRPNLPVDIWYMDFTVADVLGDGWTLSMESPEEPHEHVWGEGEVTTPATCTTDGEKTFTCVCGEKKTETIVAPGHTEVVISGKAATCTRTGLTDGVKCSACGEVLVKQEVISAKGHTEVVIPGKEATCTEDGLTDSVKCSACDEVLVEQEAISAKGHTVVIVPEVPATYESTGLTAGSLCGVCGEVLVAQKVIPVLSPEPSESPEVPESPVLSIVPEIVIPADLGEEIVDPNTPLADLPFIDVDQEEWYAQPIANVVAKGLMEGVSTMLFAPQDAMTRATMARALYALAEKPEIISVSSFLDMVDGADYADAVTWGNEVGVIKGYSDEEFGGEDALTRQQLAALLYRYAQLVEKQDITADTSVLEQFTDRDRVSAWAEDAMAWAVENELVIGRSDGTLDPRAAITRAEAAAILDRYSKLFLA